MKEGKNVQGLESLSLPEGDRRAIRWALRFDRPLVYAAAVGCVLLGLILVFLGWDAAVAYGRWMNDRGIEYSEAYGAFPYQEARYVFLFFMGVFFLLAAGVHILQARRGRVLRRLLAEVERMGRKSPSPGSPGRDRAAKPGVAL